MMWLTTSHQKHLEYQHFMTGHTGYYTFVSDDYLLDYKVYIDGNWGNYYTDDRTFNGGARGDITLHPKLVDVEGYMRYIRRDTIGNHHLQETNIL